MIQCRPGMAQHRRYWVQDIRPVVPEDRVEVDVDAAQVGRSVATKTRRNGTFAVSGVIE